MGTLLLEFFQFGLYKRTQGKVVRQATLASLVVIVLLGAYALKDSLIDAETKAVQLGVPIAIAALGCWIAFRVVQWPPFADFLISVEVEMNKVSWPRRGELYRASLVVMLVIFVMAGLLFSYDLILQAIPQLWSKLGELIAGQAG